ncbi:MAG: asparagine synthase (glutamine-hydrolyzing) [Luteolibacter sp.]
MCAIVGYLSSRLPIDRETFFRMRDSMAHRGPDGADSEFRLGDRVALGHRRLAIVDLSDRAKQPMANEDGTVWLVFNGEIYNFKELRTELENLGHRFRSDSDSEVIVHGYEAWGRGVLERLEGMFAFAIWDERRDTLLLARDRFGIKPLHYYVDREKLVFSSELKGIVTNTDIPREIDWESASDFFVCRFIPSPRSIWKDIQKLAPAHFIEYQRESGNIECHCYWKPELSNDICSTEEATERSRDLLFASVRNQLQGDVSMGVLLSGGLDSTSLMMMMAELNEPLRSFTLGFSGSNRSEHHLAREVARSFGAEHHEMLIHDELNELGSRLSYSFDEPLGGSSLLPTFLISEFASKSLKVVLAGDGGDEAFAGYTWHGDLYDRMHPSSWKQHLKGFGKRNPGADLARDYHELTSWTGWTRRDLSKVLDPGLMASVSEREDEWIYRKSLPDRGCSPIKTFQTLDYRTLLPEVFLTKIDRASMAHSLEVRVPFLDHHLVEFMMSLDESVYFNRDCKKQILYKNLENRVPSTVLHHPKQGFSVPRTHSIPLSSLERCLTHGRLLSDGILQSGALRNLVSQESYSRLWALCLFEWWYQRWVTSEN